MEYVLVLVLVLPELSLGGFITFVGFFYDMQVPAAEMISKCSKNEILRERNLIASQIANANLIL